MKIQYRHQKFQADAAKAVVDVFAGQTYLTPTYMMDRGNGNYQIGVNEDLSYKDRWFFVSLKCRSSLYRILNHTFLKIEVIKWTIQNRHRRLWQSLNFM